ncbi:MAG: hypothetical protein AVDCRST_MAG28-2045, partial [uncultured Rubrobacteraceae bacterium]
ARFDSKAQLSGNPACGHDRGTGHSLADTDGRDDRLRRDYSREVRGLSRTVLRGTDFRVSARGECTVRDCASRGTSVGGPLWSLCSPGTREARAGRGVDTAWRLGEHRHWQDDPRCTLRHGNHLRPVESAVLALLHGAPRRLISVRGRFSGARGVLWSGYRGARAPAGGSVASDLAPTARVWVAASDLAVGPARPPPDAHGLVTRAHDKRGAPRGVRRHHRAHLHKRRDYYRGGSAGTLAPAERRLLATRLDVARDSIGGRVHLAATVRHPPVAANSPARALLRTGATVPRTSRSGIPWSDPAPAGPRSLPARPRVLRGGLSILTAGGRRRLAERLVGDGRPDHAPRSGGRRRTLRLDRRLRPRPGHHNGPKPPPQRAKM